ncbi:hypothetical protein V6N13_018637 [Hibiscus sabdariffa]|uniref:Uncharacterized protein n=1 Tax=Hibiscus sabdariffa TaxID=183260 RepID=A0ABR2EQ82_9ROSI
MEIFLGNKRHSTSRESVASLLDPDKENSRNIIQNRQEPNHLYKEFRVNLCRFEDQCITKKANLGIGRNEPVRPSVSFSDVKSLIMEDNESTQKVLFSDVKSVIMEDTESKPEIGPNQKKLLFCSVMLKA